MMKYFRPMLIMAFLSALMTSCANCEEMADNGYDCVYVQDSESMDGMIDATEGMLMAECRDNAIESIPEIKSNLIGEWELIGYGQGWLAKGAQPCAYIVIAEDELTYQITNSYLDTILTYQWDVEEVNWFGGSFFQLKLIPDGLNGLSITEFCENYMLSDQTPSDGDMYLYEKVK